MAETAKTVLSAKLVNLALVSFLDEAGRRVTQLAIVGDSNIHLLNNREIGFLKEPSPAGLANPWLRDGIFEKLRAESPASVTPDVVRDPNAQPMTISSLPESV